MFALEKQQPARCLVKIKFAVCKIFKQMLSKDNKLTEDNNNNNSSDLIEQYLPECREYNAFANEIEQNQANERLLKAAQQQHRQPYVLAMETAVGSFYWDWECGMQRDSFADFNFNTH